MRSLLFITTIYFDKLFRTLKLNLVKIPHVALIPNAVQHFPTPQLQGSKTVNFSPYVVGMNRYKKIAQL